MTKTSKTMSMFAALPLALSLGAASAGEAANAGEMAAPAEATAAPKGDATQTFESCVAMKDRQSADAAKMATGASSGPAKLSKHSGWRTRRQNREECRKAPH